MSGFIKIGELSDILGIESSASCVPSVDPQVLENFQKLASELKKIAPKAEDFLYFSAVIMHAAEAAALNDNGTPKLTKAGKAVEVGWDTSNGTWKWVSNDPYVLPTKNNNGDIFPEAELIKAHKKWVHKPLCIDHKSASVDHTRGFIVDTYYDRQLKRVIALCALDKANYPDLARKVATRMQTAVSMGTGVGRAICTERGCHRVARAEADFCNHMKYKTAYGEINLDLNPLELSIVVNGADPKAHIKQVIASAQTLNSYVEMKQEELKKMADLQFNASLNIVDPSQGKEGGGSANINVISTNLEDFKRDVESAMKKLVELGSHAKQEDSNNLASNQSASTMSMQEGEEAGVDSNGLAPPHQRFADLMSSIETKLAKVQQDLEKLSHQKTQEETMSGSTKDLKKDAYFQGGGGVNEPTPGQAKYPKDPLNEDMREHGDKQMLGQPPFPGVGDVEGLHPSPSSVDPSDELKRKEMLARAEEANEKELRRQAIVQAAKDQLAKKKAYFQGGGGVNEPTPGKVKYPKDPLNEKDREEEDKQMNGQPPFPNVGKVDGLHPSPSSVDQKDELKRKEMLQRASFRARFNKVANSDGTGLDFGKSAWEVFLGDKLIVAASVNELTGGNAEMLFDSIATKDFGARLIEKVKVYGADAVKSMVKKAQMPPADPTAPAAPAMDAAPPAPEASSAPSTTPAEDTGGEGDPKESVLEMSEKARDLMSDIVEGVRVLTGDQSEMGAAAASSSQDKVLYSMRKELNATLLEGMKQVYAELKNQVEELDLISRIYNQGGVAADNQALMTSVVNDTLNAVKASLSDGFQVMGSFVNYANGTRAIIRKAELETELQALAHEHEDTTDEGLMELVKDVNSDLDNLKDLGEETLEMPADDNNAQLVVKPGETVPSNTPKDMDVKVMAGLDDKASRALLRAKLAADALGKQDNGEVMDMSKAKFNPELANANHLANGQTHLDVKPSDDLGKVETIAEINKDMLDVAKAPPKVRKEAENIHRLVSEGKLHAADLDDLVAQGLDKDAVAYYKKYYGQVEGGGEFASELVKEHVQAQMEKELETYRLKLARAYELAYDMAERGLCNFDRPSVSVEVDNIMKLNDDGFESMKRVVARYAPTMRKQASVNGKLPQVGLTDAHSELQVVVAKEDLASQLNNMFSRNSNSRRRSF